MPICGHGREAAWRFLPYLEPVLAIGGRRPVLAAPGQFMHNSPKWMEQAHRGQTLAYFPWFITKFGLCFDL